MAQFEANIIAKMDLSKAHSEWASLKSSMEKGVSVKVNTSSNGGSGGKSGLSGIATSMNKDFQMIQNMAKKLNSTKLKMVGMDNNSAQFSVLKQQLKTLESDYSSLQRTFGKKLNVDQLGKLENIKGDGLDKINEKVAKLSDTLKSAELSKPLRTFEASTSSNKTLTWLNNNTKAAKQFGDSLRLLAEKQKAATTTGELQGYNRQFKDITAQAQVLGRTGNSAFSELGRGFAKIGQFVGTYGLLMAGMNQLKQLVSTVTEVDTAMTNLYKVTDNSSSQYASFFADATVNAKALGATVADIVNSTADFARLGNPLGDASKLANVANVYKNVGDLDITSATESIVSTMQAYDIPATKAMSIADKFNEVGKVLAQAA